MGQDIFLTGGTGFLGGVLVTEILSQPDITLHLLVRARSADHFETRKRNLRQRFQVAEGSPRLRFIRGDITLPCFGLSDSAYQAELEPVDSIIHAAASTRFDLTKAEATRQNIDGGRHIVDLAWHLQKKGRLKRLDYVSTCYVGGDRKDRCFEAECDEGQQFRNSYEWSKCMGETHLREEIDRGLRATIHRPSIIVGDSRSGVASTFTALYVPIMVHSRGWWRTLPGRPDTLLDLVPVDYVAQAILALRNKEDTTLGRCFHLAAGDEAITIDDVVSRLGLYIDTPPVRYFDPVAWRRFVHPILIPFFMVSKRGRKVRNVIESFLPYFSGNPLFDTQNRDMAIPQLMPPPALDYFDKIMKYAVERDFTP